MGRWEDRVKEYMCEGDGASGEELVQARGQCVDRERWRLFCHSHILEGCFWRERGLRAIDRLIDQFFY